MTSTFDAGLFRILVEHSLDAVALLQTDGRISYVSPPITRVLGYSPEEFTSFEAFEIVHPDDRQIAMDRFAELNDQPGGSQTVVNRVRHKTGHWRWIESVSVNRLHATGINAIIVNFRDVTEQRQTAAAARVVEEKFRGIVESATEFAIFTTDLDGVVNSWNSGATRLLGYEECEVIGQDCRIFFTPEDNATEQAEAEMRDAILKGKGNDERWHVKKGGERFWGSGLMMPLRDDGGRIHGYLKIFRNMTRAKLAEEALKDADRRKDEFLAILAHELRNPLAAISNAAQLLRVPGDGHILEWSQEVISRQSKYLSRLLEDLLDVSRITQGKIRLHQERIDLAQIIGKAIQAVKPLIDEKMHSLTLLVPPSEIVVLGDAVRIEQVLVNLITNAAKYTDVGGSITIAAKRERDATITVQDNGVGIAPEMLTKIFDPFTQADRSIDRSLGGLGIGLTLAQTLVELHGGAITARSAGLGAGSEFLVRLPLAEANGGAIPSDGLQPQATLGRGFKILVVDDNRDTAMGLARILAIWGYEVSMAHDGLSALSLARSERPDAVLMDIGLPGLDGYEVARRLRQEASCMSTLLIAISGYGQDEDRRLSKEAGFDRHFVKPVDYKSLAALLSRLDQNTHAPNDDQPK